MYKLINTLKSNAKNIVGKTVEEKIIVIESDDWGSIRMPSLTTLEKLKKVGLDIESGDSFRYNNYDTLASREDLSSLFDVLTKFKDKNNNHPKFTAVSLVANPDFKKIKESDFTEYFYEPFFNTLNRYNREAAFELWKEGLTKNIFIPQFHGKEHLNVPSWMRALRNGDSDTLTAFEHGFWGFRRGGKPNFQAAFDLEYYKDLPEQHEIIKEGLILFKELHGFSAEFFVPPNGPINNDLEKTTAENGIKFISTPKVQIEVFGEGRTKKNFRNLGKKNKHGQIYITRNCFFEPSQKGKDWVDTCLYDIQLAFKWKKPAVISSHRVNYIGSLVKENRENGLRQLESLLSKIIGKWPDVEFMSSNKLGRLISGE